MATLDIFNDDAFGVTNLSLAMTNIPHTPTRIQRLGLFSEEGISSTTMGVEIDTETLTLVPAGVRGQPATAQDKGKRTLRNFQAIHLPQAGGVNADEVQNVRAFGSETELQTVQTVVNKELRKMRQRLDVTIEYHRMGALKGQVLDADGSRVLLDLFSEFGVTKQTHVMGLGTTTTKVRNKTVEAKRKVEAALGGLMYSGLVAFCSASFFDALVAHPDVERAYERWAEGAWNRDDLRAGFTFAGVTYEEYRGQVGGVDFVADGKALLVPTGVPDMFVNYFAPADYVETVNTNGIPFYAKQEPRKMGKGIDMESQSNPITLNTRPRATVELSIS